MLNKFTTIKVKGASFSTLTELKLFEPRDGKDKNGNDVFKTIKGTLLYGRNGVGKSTIAKAFRQIKGEESSTIEQIMTCDKDDNPIALLEEEKKRIFVFDEDFVDKNVRLQEDHLETIIMIGEVADLAKKIEVAETERDAAKKNFETFEEKYRDYQDNKNIKSPMYYQNQIKQALQGDGNWAGRDKRIKDRKINTQVKDNTYLQIINCVPSQIRSDLCAEFEKMLIKLDEAKKGVSVINVAVPILSQSYKEYEDEYVSNLLAMKIEKPELDEREKYLLGLVERGRSQVLLNRLAYLREEKNNTCPYCLQIIPLDHKTSLITSIEKVLSKEVENHQEALNKLKYNPIQLLLDDYKELNSYQLCTKLINSINEMILKNNEEINRKIDSPFAPILIKRTNVAELAVELSNALKTLEQERNDYNKKAIDTQPIVRKLNRINNEIAFHDINIFVKQMKKQEKEYGDAQARFKLLKRALDDKQSVLDSLVSQRNNVHLALDVLNACLEYIFFTKDRLSIVYDNNTYKLLSHGKSVRPCDISVGERNIIGLSYFFTSIMEGQEEKDVYDKEYLLIIDDPISSYDFENRIGILSFLKYKLSAFLESNMDSRALIMTHDLGTYYDLNKEYEEIVESCKQKAGVKNIKYNRYEMKINGIVPFEYKARNEYTGLVEKIFSYATGQADEYEIVVGNMMRQVLEAFSTFQYKKSIEHVSTDNDILAQLKEPEYITYYRNLMYRLVLHGGSHREEQVKTMNDFNFFSLISDEEKKKTAKDVLCFIYLLNKKHMLVHLKSCRNADAMLESWCQDIKSRTTAL